MTVIKDYSYRSAVKDYYDPDSHLTLDVTQLNRVDLPYNYYTDYDHQVERRKGNLMGNISAEIDVGLLTGTVSQIKPIDLYFRTSFISIPPPGTGVSLKQYLNNAKEKLYGAQYQLSPIILAQNKQDPILPRFTDVGVPKGIAARKIFGKDVLVISIKETVSNISYNQMFYPSHHITSNGRYQTFKETHDNKQMHGVYSGQINASLDPTKETFNRFAGNSQGRYMGYWQTEIDFIDLRPKEVFRTSDEIIRWHRDVNRQGDEGNDAPVKLVDHTRYTGSHTRSTAPFSETWYPYVEILKGSIEHYQVPNNQYMVIRPKQYDAPDRTPIFHRLTAAKVNDLYACAYSIKADNAIVIIEIDDEKVESWLHLPLYAQSHVHALTDRARYLHYSLFHVIGSNNRIIVKFDTNKLNPKFIPAHHDRLTMNLFSFAPETTGNSIILAFTQSDLEKRRQAGYHYFDRNLPPEGITEQTKDRFSLIRTYPLSVPSRRLRHVHGVGAPSTVNQRDVDYFRYFDDDDLMDELYNAYPMIPRLNNIYHGINLLGSDKFFTTNIIVGSDTKLPYYEQTDGIDTSGFSINGDIPTLPSHHPIKSTKNRGTYYRDFFFYTQFIEHRDSIKVKYHLHRPDPYTDGTKYQRLDQIGSCFNALALIMHVKPASTVDDGIERIYIIEGAEEKTYYFESQYSSPTLFAVTGNNLDVTFVIRCKLNIVVKPAEYNRGLEADLQSKLQQFVYNTVAVHGNNNKVKIIYDEGCYIRFVHQGNQIPRFIPSMFGDQNPPHHLTSSQIHHFYVEDRAMFGSRYIVDKNHQPIQYREPEYNYPAYHYGGFKLPNTQGDGSPSKPWWAGPMTAMIDYNRQRNRTGL